MTGTSDIILANRFGYGIRPGAPRPDPDLLSQLETPWFTPAPPGPDVAERMRQVMAFLEFRKAQDRQSDAYVAQRRRLARQVQEDIRRLII